MKIKLIASLIILIFATVSYAQGGRQLVAPKSAHQIKKERVLKKLQRREIKEAAKPQASYFVSRSGTVYPGPAGVKGPTRSRDGKGVVFEGKPAKPGGPTMLRFMEPRPAIGNAPAYPNGVVVYGKRHANGKEQNVKPDGKPGSRDQVHIPFK